MEEFDDKIRRMVEGNNSDESNSEDQEIKHILDVSKNWKAPDDKSKEESWSQIELMIKNSADSKDEAQKSKSYMAIAATITLLLVGSITSYTLFFSSIVNSTEVSEVKTIYLPDSSMVILNALSSIEYNKSDFNENRKLSLNGQAYFEVKKGSTFSISTGSVETEVLGTSFNIYSRDKFVEVECISGKVKVTGENHQLTLTKGEKISASNSILKKQKSSFNLTNAISWTTGKFYYDNASLNKVVREIEIQFDVTIESIDFNNRYYTGYFDDKNLENALKQVLIPMGYLYEIKDKSVIVSRN